LGLTGTVAGGAFRRVGFFFFFFLAATTAARAGEGLATLSASTRATIAMHP
jgi:hypothetical protein